MSETDTASQLAVRLADVTGLRVERIGSVVKLDIRNDDNCVLRFEVVSEEDLAATTPWGFTMNLEGPQSELLNEASALQSAVRSGCTEEHWSRSDGRLVRVRITAPDGFRYSWRNGCSLRSGRRAVRVYLAF